MTSSLEYKIKIALCQFRVVIGGGAEGGKKNSCKGLGLPTVTYSGPGLERASGDFWNLAPSSYKKMQATKFCTRKQCLYHNCVNFMERCLHFYLNCPQTVSFFNDLQRHIPRSNTALKSIWQSFKEEISLRIKKFCQVEDKAHTPKEF